MSSSQSWSVVLHGGCSNNCPDVETQHKIQRNLEAVLETAVSGLKAGVTAREVVVHAVTALEDCPLFNAGKGAALTIEGDHELEAGLVDGRSGLYGAVSCLMTTKNPILAANAILQHGVHCMMVGNAADSMAQKVGLESVPNTYFETAIRRAYWASTIRNRQRSIEFESGTVGAVALDIHGHIAAGGSSGGISGKNKGRIGDTAVFGAGLFADSKLGVTCSGAGDEIFRQLLARQKLQPSIPVASTLRTPLASPFRTLDGQGKLSIQSTARLFSTASASSNHQATVDMSCTTFPVLPQHVFFRNWRLVAGLSRYPTTRGESFVILKQPGVHLFSLERKEFLEIMSSVKNLANALRDHYNVGSCALVIEGNGSISILPLHGLEKTWKPVTSHEKEFHETFPGYISSKDGPTMDVGRLAQITATIRRETELKEPVNCHFEGDDGDSNLFARLVRGEIPQSRVWEDEGHVAFLTPFANTPGFTVLVPREHLTSDIFGLEDTHYKSLMDATYTLAGYLKKAFGAPRCGMIFEGFEINYAHVKLIPIHSRDVGGQIPTSSPTTEVAPYEERYSGYVTSLKGPLFQDQESLALDASSLRKATCEHNQPSLS
ncbi:N-terminal nucleophile aminohydrolase [Aaosphaeria arxii CBS 175.79]|uniref:N-terminal nucleophile aminohydrolase n=1 Tax=Aaosphaeria arxii CBS 175.79 TaxID=1450172 RepID=A0A6A5Y4S4_9PLEO|nr:N-terminal nucleophile aminohydrolase [Aaosphaeria arxii CBS 175.79]KAF2020256.1 N-terminal nucleophile aminohydrolase [Aaosphaeria arxii CBS 175.79]